jgi:hypothetical protein
MITLIGVDPGNTESAYVAMAGTKIDSFGKIANRDLLNRLDYLRLQGDALTVLAVERVASYGKPVGFDVFDTVEWIGRFIERWGGLYTRIMRATVKAAVCGDARAKDANVRAALLDRWGGKVAAVGNAKAPGPLHGISKDVWSALAVVVTYQERADVGSGRGLTQMARAPFVVEQARPT